MTDPRASVVIPAHEGRGKIAMSRLMPKGQDPGVGRAGAGVVGVLAAGVGAAVEMAGPRGNRPSARSEGALA